MSLFSLTQYRGEKITIFHCVHIAQCIKIYHYIITITTSRSAASGSNVTQLSVDADDLFQSRNMNASLCVQSFTVDITDWNPSGTGSSCCVAHIFTTVVELYGLINFYAVVKQW